MAPRPSPISNPGRANVAKECGHTLSAFQSNAEHELIGRIHQAGRESTDFLILNPGAFTHTALHCGMR